MKYFENLLILFCVAISMVSCRYDNYDEPSEILRGDIVDKQTKEPYQTAIGPTGVRIRLMEYSWSDTPTPYDFYCRMDGTFQNTKLFPGRYGVTPTGAFVPLEEQIIDIEGEQMLRYEVEPFLRLEWVGEPVVNADGTADIQVKISRGTDNPDYQDAIAEVWLFVSETSYVGDFSYSPRFSTHLLGANVNDILGKTVTIRTGQPQGPGEGNAQNLFPDYSRKFFLRVGARINRQVEGQNVYNYTTVKEIQTIAREE